jgi:hypothetical protein
MQRIQNRPYVVINTKKSINNDIKKDNDKWGNFPSENLVKRSVMLVLTFVYWLLTTIMVFICKFFFIGFHHRLTAHAYYPHRSDEKWGSGGGGITADQINAFLAKCSEILEPFSNFIIAHPTIAIDTFFVTSVILITLEVIPEVIKAITIVTMPIGALAVGATVAGTTVLAGAQSTGIPGVGTAAAVITTTGFIFLKAIQLNPMNSQEFVAFLATFWFFGCSVANGVAVLSPVALGVGTIVGGVAVTTGVAVAAVTTGHAFGLVMSAKALWIAFGYVGTVASAALYGTVGRPIILAAKKSVVASPDVSQIALNSSTEVLVINADIIVAATSEFESLLIYTISWW